MVVPRTAFILLLAGFGPALAWGQEQEPTGEKTGAVPDTVVQRVSTAFQTGDAKLLLAPAADRVEVSLFGTRTFYSSAQAFYVLREFFNTHPPAEFTVADATGAGQSSFLRGQLKHARAERPLRVYVRLVRQGRTWQVHEVRIDSVAE